MGYEEAVFGWCRLRRPIDPLTAVLPPVSGAAVEAFGDQPWWFHATGRGHDHVLFASDGKRQSNLGVALLRALVHARGDAFGLMMSTGEIPHDGRDRAVLVRDGRVVCLPIRHLYDSASPWHGIYLASHYMSRDLTRLAPVDAEPLRAALAGRTDVHGWLKLPFGDDREARGAAAAATILAAAPDLDCGLTVASPSEPQVLVGQDGVNPTAAAAAVARVTPEQPGAYALLYCGTPTDGGRSQVPVAIKAGRALALALPSLSIDPADYADAVPARTDAYSWLGGGCQWLPLRSGRDLRGTYDLISRALSATGNHADHWREPATADARPEYLFDAAGLTWLLMGSVAADPADAAEWPHHLAAYLTHEADPDVLADRVRSAADRLRAAGIEVGPVSG